MNRQNMKFEANKKQRGAALITVLLISTLLLVTGGALVLVTGLSTRTTIDATAEMQAYYAAESGLQDTLNVLRGNVNPQPSMPGNSKINFLKAITPNDSNRPGDGTGLRHLSGWLNYNVNDANGRPDRVALTANYTPLTGLAYNVEVSDPDAGITPPNTQPERLLLRVRGFGPKNAEKRLELIVKRTTFDYIAPAMIMLRGADGGGATVTVNDGDSAAKGYSGHDFSSSSILPTFGATTIADMNIEVNADTKDTVVDPKAANISLSSLPTFLQTTDGPGGARDFLYGDDGAMALAQTQNRYFTYFDGTANGFTFVDGDCALDGGSGLLIVTGHLVMNGNGDFDGLILVMGEGTVERTGAGNGQYHGAMAVARFNRTSGPFLAPSFISDGAGTGDMIYDSAALRQALNTTGPLVMGVHEY